MCVDKGIISVVKLWLTSGKPERRIQDQVRFVKSLAFICCRRGVIRLYKLTIQVRIQDLVKGGAPASEAESCRRSGAESHQAKRAICSWGPGPTQGPWKLLSFSTQICILPYSRAPFFSHF